DAYLSCSSMAQHVLPELLDLEDQTQDYIRNRIDECLKLLSSSGLEELGWTFPAVDGGFTALLRLPAVLDEATWWRKFSENGVWLEPGALYGFDQSPIFALSLLTPPETLRAAIGRFKELSPV